MGREHVKITENEYMTFPRQFESYRWFKPILVLLLTCIFAVVFIVAIVLLYMLCSGDKNVFQSLADGTVNFFGYGVLISEGLTATAIPALALASLIVKDRPFSSYSSSRGGWNWTGLTFTLICGISFAIIVWKTKGLEAIGAMHTVINLSSFLLTGFGLWNTNSQMTMVEMFAEVAAFLIYLMFILFIADKKMHWFRANIKSKTND